MEAGKTIIEVGLAARMKNPGFFVQKMYKNVHTRLEAHNTAEFHKIKKIYVGDFPFSRIFLVKYFFGLKTTFAHFHVFSLTFTFIHTFLKILFRKVHKKVHTGENPLNRQPLNKKFVKFHKQNVIICVQTEFFRSACPYFNFHLINLLFLF